MKNSLLLVLLLGLSACTGTNDKKNSDTIGRNVQSLDTDSLVVGNTYTLSGTVCIGHEVRSFKPDGMELEYWIVDKSGKLTELYDKATDGVKNGKPLHATLKLEYNGKWDDGFAAEYPGVYIVKEVISVGDK